MSLTIFEALRESHCIQCDRSTAAWQMNAVELSHTVRHHFNEEERGFFQQAGRILTEKQQSNPARRYLRDLKLMKKVLVIG